MLKSENDLAKALQQGLFVDSIFLKTKPFVQNGIQTIRWFKSQKFGHINAKCQPPEKCGHCSENQLIRDCPSKKQENKCANCDLKHPANFSQCDVYIKQLQAVMKSRGLDQSTPHDD